MTEDVLAPGILQIVGAIEGLSQRIDSMQAMQNLHGETLQLLVSQAPQESVQATVTSPAIVLAQSTTASSSYYMKLCEASALFSGVRAKLTRWLKDVEDFYKLKKVLDLDKVLVAKNRISQDLKEWFDLYEVENGAFQNWKSLKAALIEHYSDTLARQKARKDLKKCRCTRAGIDDYNKRFKPLVTKLKGRLIKEDIVEDYISGLPADVRLETNKAHPVNLVIAMKTASELEVFLSGGEGLRGGTRDFQRPSAFKSDGESAQRNSLLGQEERPVPMDLCRVHQLPPPLTPAERSLCIAEGRCFRCCLAGHTARQCPGPFSGLGGNFSGMRRLTGGGNPRDLQDYGRFRGDFRQGGWGQGRGGYQGNRRGFGAPFPTTQAWPPLGQSQWRGGCRDGGPRGRGRGGRKPAGRGVRTIYGGFETDEVIGAEGLETCGQCPEMGGSPENKDVPIEMKEEENEIGVRLGLFVFSGRVTGIPIRVLVDSGTDDIYLDRRFAHIHHLHVCRLRRPVNLHSALKSSKTRSVCECVPTVLINIQGYQETVGAMLANLDEYDLILGTKWGRAYEPELQWSSQSLRFWFRRKLIYWVPDVELEEEDKEQTFSTPPLLFSMQAKRAIRKGAVCHLVRLQTEIPFGKSTGVACRVQGLHE
eukprot:Cvel_9772.t1-p1 / transcript=Cvel_9772.t1 / gene=Cvel_9772 / organism=Chromera_velia_CCMP2878 / gene_product=hypothetical protein / transcript_product=hypothetical protein / location=Cvel_scaffold572:64651-66588(+) / protein_length=646 / sequence_SO=supercontig / SO=protein_coding / is_pseudo=false